MDSPAAVISSEKRRTSFATGKTVTEVLRCRATCCLPPQRTVMDKTCHNKSHAPKGSDLNRRTYFQSVYGSGRVNRELFYDSAATEAVIHRVDMARAVRQRQTYVLCCFRRRGISSYTPIQQTCTPVLFWTNCN